MDTQTYRYPSPHIDADTAGHSDTDQIADKRAYGHVYVPTAAIADRNCPRSDRHAGSGQGRGKGCHRQPEHQWQS